MAADMGIIPAGGLPDGNQVGAYGQMGDYIGGVWGTLFAALTTIVVFATWRTARKNDARNRILAVLAEMLKTHDLIVEANPNLSGEVLREFSHVYKATRRVQPDDAVWSIDTRVDIAYTYVFYGLSVESRRALERHGDLKIKAVHDALSRLRDRGGAKFKAWFKGRQATLSHYMRNLFSMYVFIEKAKLRGFEKRDLGKVVRSKLSNYDQAVLALNVISHLGSEWEQHGFVQKYKPFANVPQHFFGYDAELSLKKRFPGVLFEWEKHSPPRPEYRRIAIGAVKIVWYREWHRLSEHG